MRRRRDGVTHRVLCIAVFVMICLTGASACSDRNRVVDRNPHPDSCRDQRYELQSVFEVAGRQGIAADGERYYVSGSKALYVYSMEGELLVENKDPFAALAKPANHIGDIDVHDGEIYAGIEWFVDGEGRDIQIAIYDAESLEYRRSIDWNPESGQVEVSAVAVDPGHGLIWMTDWVDGSYVYRYDLVTGSYAGKLHLRPVPQWQQGMVADGRSLLISADDGDADLDEADNLWRVAAETDSPGAFVFHEWTFDDLRRAGEIEGVTIDPENGDFLVLSNRGARIVLGMPSGFYPGYDREIHEVYVYSRR